MSTQENDVYYENKRDECKTCDGMGTVLEGEFDSIKEVECPKCSEGYAPEPDQENG